MSVGLEVEAPLSQNLLDFILDETKAPIAEEEKLSEEEPEATEKLNEEKEVMKEEKEPEDIAKVETEVPEEEIKEESSAIVPDVKTERYTVYDITFLNKII